MITISQKCRLETQHDGIEIFINDIPDDRMKIHKDNKWSIKDQIAHLAKYQPEFIKRMKLIAETEEPSFERYRAESDPEFEMYRKLPLEILIKKLNFDRNEIIHFIASLSEQQLNRKGKHPVYGSLTIIEWVEFFLLHEAHHLLFIFQIAHNTII